MPSYQQAQHSEATYPDNEMRHFEFNIIGSHHRDTGYKYSHHQTQALAEPKR